MANTYSLFLGAGKLPAGSTGTYAVGLIRGAVNGTIPVSEFIDAPGSGGGRLVVGANITTATVIDLSSIANVFANGIVKSYGNAINTPGGTAATNAAGQIGAVTAAIVKFVGNETFTDTQNSNQSGYVAVYIAATLADYIVSLKLDGGSTASNSPQTLILNAIKTDVDAVTNSAVNAQVNTQIGDAGPGSVYVETNYGPIAVQTATVTNL